MLISCNKQKASTIFEINPDFSCKPASNYMLQTDILNKDSITFMLSVKNNIAQRQDIVLEFPIQQIENVTITQKDNQHIVQQFVFTSKKLNQRFYYDRNIVFPFSINATSTSIFYFKFLKDDYPKTSNPELLIWSSDAKISSTQSIDLSSGIFYGIIILYTFICLLLAYLLRAENYYYYLLYLISGTAYLFIKNNLAYELIWPNSPNIDIFFKKIMLSVYLITSILFLRGFIKKRMQTPTMQKILGYFILFGLLLILVSLVVGLLSTPAQRTFIVIQTIFSIVCFVSVVFIFIVIYLNSNEHSLIIFTALYFISFSFFLFYPQPEFGSSFFGIYFGQIFMYSNAFFIAAVISIFVVYRVIQILKVNDKMKKEMSDINALNNFSLIQGQQNERTRIGRELHDGIGIMMSASKMKLSSLKLQSTQEKNKVAVLNKEIDVICDTIRSLSHTLLPPTLQKFGLQVALSDMIENFKHQQKIEVDYNFNIPDNLSFVSQQLIYDILQHFLHYFADSHPTQINISIYVLPSIKEAQIRIQHTNANTDLEHEDIKSIIAVVDLLNAKFQSNILNARNARIHIEIPILVD